MTNATGDVVNRYIYEPYGKELTAEAEGTLYNPFLFTGQYIDAEIDQYWLRARQYDLAIMRFTTYDPVRGGFKEPLTLHRYLYCLNDPINRTDITGKYSLAEGVMVSSIMGALRGMGRWANGGSPMDVVAGGLAGAVGGLIGGQAWFGAAGIMAKCMTGMVAGGASGLISEGGHILGEGIFKGDWNVDFERVTAEIIANGIIGGALGSFSGLADHLEGIIHPTASSDFYMALVSENAT